MYNCFRTIWRCLDQALTFWIQHRLAKINNMRTNVIQVTSKAITFNNKRPSIFTLKLKLSQLSAKIEEVGNNQKRK
uniref:Ovule protein n=1 Tax=Acrobeloides nanus TaxID=290746 RepID=A0A914DY88_9BILA